MTHRSRARPARDTQSMNEWHFTLEGDHVDIRGVTDLFASEVNFITDEFGKVHLVMELPFSTAESSAAQDAAEELLAKLNAIAQIMYGNHENLRIVGIGCKDPSGAPMHLFIHMSAGIRSHARVGGGLTVKNSSGSAEFSAPPVRIGDQFLTTADANEHLERALYLFGSLPLDWRGLYMVLEAAEDSHGGEAGLIAKEWVPDGQIKGFKATSCSYKALRLEARHGSIKSGIEQPKLTLAEARDMIRTILEKWMKERL
jgi:hypothetical protein